MNCLCSEGVRAQNLHNKRLEKNLQIYKRKYNKQIKLLLLGTNGSGKSTFLRHMRFVHSEPYMAYDFRIFVDIINQNIFHAMQIMIEAMNLFQITFEYKENAVYNSDVIRSVDLSARVNKYLKTLKELWADAGIQECFMRGRQYGLPDSTKYFFNQLDRIADPNYRPSIQDILRARIPSKNFKEHSFQYKNVEFLITDVGYQRSEYKKWIHCFDNVTAIIYMVAISEYDQFSLDSNHHNRLKESVELLRTIISYKYFEDIALILVFNKFDILEEKIMYSHLSDYFPEYTGSPYNARQALDFITNMFLRNIPSKRRVYSYSLSSTDENNQSILFVYRAVRDTILNANLYNFNLV